MDNDLNFFDTLLKIFDYMFKSIQTEIFNSASAMYLNGIITAFLTIAILIYATRKIKEGTFQFPKDIIEVVIFLAMVWFVQHSLSNQSFVIKLTNYLDIPANLAKSLIQQTNFSNNIPIGTILSKMLYSIFDTLTIFIGNENYGLLDITFDIIIKTVIWFIYAYLAFILLTSIATTYLLNYLQILFWKAFAIVMIPLIYFKVTRGMVIHWLKTIIALSLISAFMIVIGKLNIKIEAELLSLLGNDKTKTTASYSLIAGFIVGKIICITFLKEIPAMINGMLGTQAAQGAGQFANSVTMGSIGAAGAGAGFVAFKGAMKAGGMAKKGLEAVGNTGLGGAKTIADATGATGVAKSLTGNVSKTISNIANSRFGKGVSNIAQGNSAFKDNPKMMKAENIGLKNK